MHAAIRSFLTDDLTTPTFPKLTCNCWKISTLIKYRMTLVLLQVGSDVNRHFSRCFIKMPINLIPQSVHIAYAGKKITEGSAATHWLLYKVSAWTLSRLALHREIMPLRIAAACATWCHSSNCQSGERMMSGYLYTVAFEYQIKAHTTLCQPLLTALT